ncbi:MAG: DNA repair protein RecN [Armatimonadetes bacterium]|nr:DNA repair protein RecN [Armatimonadota bacterium]
MLTELQVKNFALVEDAVLEFSEGLHVLTGETGAGKSLVVDAIGFLLGDKAGQEILRKGADHAEVVGAFQVAQPDPEWDATGVLPSDEGYVILSRRWQTGGRNTCRINGSLVPMASLKQVGRTLVEIHGQNEHQRLLHPSTHLDYVDGFGGKTLEDQLTAYRQEFRDWKDMEKEILKRRARAVEAARQADFLAFEVSEIEGENLQPGEDLLLEREKELLSNMERIQEKTASALELLSGDSAIRDKIHMLQTLLSDLAPFVPADLQESSESLKRSAIELQELGLALAGFQDRLERDPERLEKVQERLHRIGRLKKKYGQDIEAILSHGSRAAAELEALRTNDSRIEEIEKERIRLERDLEEKAASLTLLRKKAATDLASRVVTILHRLGMPSAHFEIALEATEELSERGREKAEFLIAPNPGEGLRPLARIASGGELSRIMLALRAVLTDADRIETLVFDEIDSGLGGEAGFVVASVLSGIARQQQVLCVTHLHSIAAASDKHFHVVKEVRDGRTATEVRVLSGPDRPREIARMIGGEQYTEAALTQARQMLEVSSQAVPEIADRKRRR